MSFYLDLLEQQYSILEDAHQRSMQESKVLQEASTLCACGLAYVADCPGNSSIEVCEEGAQYLADTSEQAA